MSFTSLSFLAFVLAGAFVAQWLRGPWRLGFLLVLNLVFAVSFIADPLAAVPLLAFVVVGYGAVLLAEGGRVRHAVGVSVVLLVGAFVWLKRYPFAQAIPELPFDYALVGLSYILFRLLHVIIEVGDGALKRPSFPHYMAYLFFFPAFLSGPIHRYEPFGRDLDEPAKMDRDVAYGTLLRFLIGFAKVAVIGECVLLVQAAVAGRLDGAVADQAPFPIIAAIYAFAAGLYLLFLYANFSGYTDMAIAVGRLFGIILPENFNRPFMASNIQDFWSRWHMTLSEWFKIYFFNPLLKLLMQRFPSAAAAPYLGVLALFIVFVVLGAWHGSSWEFLLTGVLLGSGVGLNKLYQVEMIKLFGKKPYQAMTKRPTYVWCARGFTLAWVAVALTPFWIPVDGIGRLLGEAGPLGLTASVVGLSAVFAISLLMLITALDRLPPPLTSGAFAQGIGWRVATLTALMLALAFAVPLVNTSTDFVYQAF